MDEPEVIESLDILLEFGVPKPPPKVAIRFAEPKWSLRLAPLRGRPGQECRVARDLTADRGRMTKYAIQRALYRANPREKWTVSCRGDNKQVWGVWVTYGGIMTEAEYLESERARQQRHDEWAQRKLVKQARTATTLGRSRLSGSLRPPTLDD